MSSQAVVSLAILKVNWDKLKKDYLENFVPIVAECIRISQNDLVSIPDLQRQLRGTFGLQIPQNAIKSILRRVQRRGYIKLQYNVYVRENSALEQLNFHKVQQQVLRMHETLIEHLVRFSAERFETTWNCGEAENAFQAYVEEHQLALVSYSIGATPIIPYPSQAIRGSKYIVGAFIQNLYETQSADIDYMETVVKGNLLANAIFLPDSSRTFKKFRKTSVYFDTSFLLFALGYAGEARKDPCTELLHLLYENGADLKCFRHTLEETRGALDACAWRIRQGQLSDAYGPSIEYFLANGNTPSDIELFASTLKRDLGNLRIQIADKPPYVPQYVIDEQKLLETLQANLQYHNPLIAPQRDVDSVSAIMRLREGLGFFELEECRALFVTTNSALVRTTRNFFIDDQTSSAVPPCIPDYVLTNLLWLKKPVAAPDLPRKRIVADYYAATQPEERLWKCYVAEVDKLQRSGQVTADEYYLLRYSLEAKTALMNLTLGEPEAFTFGTIPEILAMVRAKIQSEKESQIRIQSEQRVAAEQEVQSLRAAENKRLAHRKFRSQQIAHWIADSTKPIFLGILLVGITSTFPWEFPKFDEKPLNYGITILQIGILLLSVGNLMYGTTIEGLVRRFELRLAELLEKKITDLFEKT